MKHWLFYFSFLVVVQGWAQVDTLNPLTEKQIADSIYGNLNSLVTTKKLYNRLLFESTNVSTTWNTNLFHKDSTKNYATADHIYNLLDEIKKMSIDTASEINPLLIFNQAQTITGESEFDFDKYIYPIGIFDYNYNYLDEISEINNGNLLENNYVLSPINEDIHFTTKNAAIIAPLYDLFDSPEMGITFKRNFFFSNYRNVSEIQEIKLFFNSDSATINFDQIYFFNSNSDTIQKFKVRITYVDGTAIEHYFVIRTPNKKIAKSDDSTLPGCTEFLINGNDEIEISGNKIQWCLIPRCDYDGRILKPYFLLTGYRPPALEQSFEKTWQYYNDEHGELLTNLIANNYDVFLVRFNIHAKPYSHGMLESAELLKQFIEGVNELKNATKGHENVIQGSSMSADIANLALLMMEKKHLADNNYPHHHSRLFISYDANFYGANLPLAYQYQIYSGFQYPAKLIAAPPLIALAQGFIRIFLYATMEQKTVKQLLMYHAKANHPLLFFSPVQVINSIPTHHQNRQDFYDALTQNDNGRYFYPMPLGTRNISISLGKIKETNNDGDDRFIPEGDTWRNINLLLWRFKIRAGKYTPPGDYTDLFIRRKIGVSFSSLWTGVFMNHKVNVSQMQEIDNASGSYLPGTGNLVRMTNLAYFPAFAAVEELSGNVKEFSHKSVLTGLCINKTLWPSNGSHTLDMQQMGLMYINKLPSGILVSSVHFGYPNLGRPDDHFQITPFEAIYIDTTINPHIRYNEVEDAVDVPFVNDFMLNEIEPWYLGLQNNHLGSTARSNYKYYSYRRAKHQIIVGNNVTPMTDKGDYVVEANANLTLKAGDEILLKPGVHFKAGSTVYITPDYEVCNDLKNGSANVNNSQSNTTSNTENDYNYRTEQNLDSRIVIFPNPTTQNLEIKVLEEIDIVSVSVYDLMGKELFKSFFSSNRAQLNLGFLKDGVYLAKVCLSDNSVVTKQIQKL